MVPELRKIQTKFCSVWLNHLSPECKIRRTLTYFVSWLYLLDIYTYICIWWDIYVYIHTLHTQSLQHRSEHAFVLRFDYHVVLHTLVNLKVEVVASWLLLIDSKCSCAVIQSWFWFRQIIYAHCYCSIAMIPPPSKQSALSYLYSGDSKGIKLHK